MLEVGSGLVSSCVFYGNTASEGGALYLVISPLPLLIIKLFSSKGLFCHELP